MKYNVSVPSYVLKEPGCAYANCLPSHGSDGKSIEVMTSK